MCGVSCAHEHGISERGACRLVNQYAARSATSRTSGRRRSADPGHHRACQPVRTLWLSRITALLKRAGWHVGHDRVERIWRREGLKVPRSRNHADGCGSTMDRVYGFSKHANHVWSFDFVSTNTHDGRRARMLNLIDESTRECLLNPSRSAMDSAKVIEALADVMVSRASRNISAQTMAPSSLLATCELADRHRRQDDVYHPALHGRTATVNDSTRSCGMNF